MHSGLWGLQRETNALLDLRYYINYYSFAFISLPILQYYVLLVTQMRYRLSCLIERRQFIFFPEKYPLYLEGKCTFTLQYHVFCEFNIYMVKKFIKESDLAIKLLASSSFIFLNEKNVTLQQRVRHYHYKT